MYLLCVDIVGFPKSGHIYVATVAIHGNNYFKVETIAIHVFVKCMITCICTHNLSY